MGWAGRLELGLIYEFFIYFGREAPRFMPFTCASKKILRKSEKAIDFLFDICYNQSENDDERKSVQALFYFCS